MYAYPSASGEKASSNDEAARLILQGLEETGVEVGELSNLADFLRSVPPSNQDVRLIGHPDENTFSLFSIPTQLAEALDCKKLVEQGDFTYSEGGEKVYGKSFATGFQFDVPGQTPAVLYLIWTKDRDKWKIASYHVETP